MTLRFTEASGGAEAPGKGTVLVVDDEPLVLNVAQQSLAAAGYRTVEAAHGGEALTLVANDPVDLVLLDLNMPNLDGWQTLELRRQMAPSLPVLIMSGYSSEQEARERGADGLIEKPYHHDALVQLVDRFLG